jgi:hypothetical protein
MDWVQVFSIILGVVGLNWVIIAWLRSDIKSFESEVRGWKDELHRENKDFHGRLCSLEERYRTPKTDP